ncbi:MAG: hypothetical protein M3Z04_04650 [Chloroflexota bacterium]|nr:hypothetical protein [Chloroflexota bacterium]
MPPIALPTPLQPGDPPDFYKRGAYAFENLCRDLLSMEEDVTGSDAYGEPGQKQYGIDLQADLANGSGIVVGQCKAYKDFPPLQIRAASDVFFDHWESRWKTRNVRRFILFVGSSLDLSARREEITKQKARFAEKGIDYDAWDAARILNKIRPHRSLIHEYLGPFWLEYLHGMVSLTPTLAPTRATDQLIAHTLDLVSLELDTTLDHEVEQMRQEALAGNVDTVRQRLAALRSNTSVWLTRSPSMQARLLRFAAGLELTPGESTDLARTLADEAHRVAPLEPEVRIRARIRYYDAGPAAALALVETDPDPDSIQLRITWLLELGQVAEAAMALATLPREGPQATATWRLVALVAVAQADLATARTAIDTARSQAPHWLILQYEAALIDYYSALAPLAVPPILPGGPLPVEWDLVRRDDASQTALRRASTAFTVLAARELSNSPAAAALHLWRLACLANDIQAQEAAIALAQERLKADPTDPGVISWIIVRRFPLDLKPSERALKRALQQNPADLPRIVAQVQCLLVEERPRPRVARKLLIAAEAHFTAADRTDTWKILLSQVEAQAGLVTEALTRLATTSDPAIVRDAQAGVLQWQARHTDDWEPLIAYLTQLYTDTGAAQALLDLCDTWARLGRWTALAEYATRLVAGVPTEAALRLALQALYNAHRFAEALDLLATQQALFPGEGVPGDLRRLQARCQHRAGLLPAAQSMAEALVQEDPSTENLLTLAGILFDSGDLVGLTTLARRLRGGRDVPQAALLRLARNVRWNDPKLAVSLWQQAVQTALPDELVMPAVNIGFLLRRDQELEPLLARMEQLAQAGQPGVQAVSLEDILTQIEQRRGLYEDFMGQYQAGILPIQVATDALNIPLAVLYHPPALLDQPLTNPPILARHGRRTLLPTLPAPPAGSRLIPDLTAILLAAHLDLFDALDASGLQLALPAPLIPALIHLRDQVTPHQPAEGDARDYLLTLVARGAIQIADPLPAIPLAEYAEIHPELARQLTQARRQGGVLVTLWPLLSLDLNALAPVPEAARPYLLTCGTLVEALQTSGLLDAATYTAVRHQLGSQAEIAPSTNPPDGSTPLFFTESALRLLAGTPVLPELSTLFPLYLFPDDVKELQTAQRHAAHNRDLADWLGNLIQRLRDGVASSIYQRLPSSAEEVPKLAGSPPVTQVVLAALQGVNSPQDLLWIDDRALTRYESHNTCPIVGINEVLKWLVATRQLSDETYYRQLLALRAANVRFIPLEAGEILYHLHKADNRPAGRYETPALAILRRYHAVCLLPEAGLQRLPPEQIESEVSFLLAGSAIIREALDTLWFSPGDVTGTEAAGHWILDALYLDRPDPITAITGDMLLQQVALSLAGLLLPLLTRPPTTEFITQRRRVYGRWIWQRVLAPRCAVEPRLAPFIAEILRGWAESLNVDPLATPGLDVRAVLIQAIYVDLPVALRIHWARDLDFMAQIGLPYGEIVTIRDWEFDPPAMFQATEQAFRGQPATLAVLETADTVQVQADGFRLELNGPGESQTVHLNDPRLGILHPDPALRHAALAAHRGMLDVGSATLDQILAAAAQTPDPAARSQLVTTYWESSVTRVYGYLEQQLATGATVSGRLLRLPSLTGWMRHLRLDGVDPAAPFPAMLAEDAPTLLAEEGLAEALTRLQGLPIPLPDSIYRAFAAASSTERRSQIHAGLRAGESPVSIMHLLRLLACCEADDPAYPRFARRLIGQLLQPTSAKWFEAFQTVLAWAMTAMPPDDALPTDTRPLWLAAGWSHAHRIFAGLMRWQVPAATIIQDFAHWRGLAQESLARVSLPDDIATQRLTWETFLLDGLAYSANPVINTDPPLQRALQRFVQWDSDLLHPAVLQDVAALANRMGTWLGAARDTQYPLLLGSELGAILTTAALDDTVQSAIDCLLTDPRHPEAWLHLRWIVGTLPPQAARAPAFYQLLQETAFAALITDHPLAGWIGWGGAVHQARYDTGLRTRLHEQFAAVVQAVKTLGADQPRAAPIPALGHLTLEYIETQLIEWAIQLADPASEYPGRLAALWDILRTEWPGLLEQHRDEVQYIIAQTPVEHTGALWQLYLRLRAAA